MLVCKYNNVFLPIMFNIMFRLNQYVHSYNTRNLHKTSMVASEISLQSIRIMAAIIWNYFNPRHNIITYSLMNYKCPNH